MIVAPICALPAETGAVFRGKLTSGPGGKPALESSGGVLLLTGDEATMGVLKDPRLAGADFEVHGKLEAGTVSVNPIHTRALFVHKNGKRLLVTYWCDVCYIRTYTPGRCWCCQDDTRLDLIDPEAAESK